MQALTITHIRQMDPFVPDECRRLNTTQVGLTKCTEVTEEDNFTTPPVAKCPCTDSIREFWNTARNANPRDVFRASEVAVGVQPLVLSF